MVSKYIPIMLKGGAKYFDAKRHAKKDHYGERTPEKGDQGRFSIDFMQPVEECLEVKIDRVAFNHSC